MTRAESRQPSGLTDTCVVGKNRTACAAPLGNRNLNLAQWREPSGPTHVERLADELANAFHFAGSVVTRNNKDARWRQRIRQRFGKTGVVELALAVAIWGVFPTIKRGMGFATVAIGFVSRLIAPTCMTGIVL